MADKKRPKFNWSSAMTEARCLIWARRPRLALGLALLIPSRLSGMVLPATTKFLIDEVIGNGRRELLVWLALAAGIATLVQASTSFALSILLGVAGQRAINDLRLRVQRHIGRLPVRYFEDHKSGELISRIMTDAEGVRNLVGTGFVQLLGGLFTAALALAVLLWLNWRLTALTLVLLVFFSALMVVGFSRLRPLFRERGKLNADVTARLVETLNGIKVIKAYTAEKHEELVFATLTHKLLRNITQSMVGVILRSCPAAARRSARSVSIEMSRTFGRRPVSVCRGSGDGEQAVASVQPRHIRMPTTALIAEKCNREA